MTDVPSAEALGHQHFYRLPEQLSAWIAEQHLGLSVHDLDQTRGVDDDHPVGGRLQESPKLGFRSLFALTSDRRHATCYQPYRLGWAAVSWTLPPQQDSRVRPAH